MDEELSRLLEDVLIVSKIVLNGEVVSTLTIRSEAGLREALRRFCGKGLYYVSVRGAEGEARLLVKDGSVVACSLRGAGGLRGREGVAALTKFAAGGRATIMRFSESVLPEDALKRIERVSTRGQAPEPPPRQAAGTGEAVRGASVAGVNAAGRPPKEELLSMLNRIGVPVRDAATVEGADYVVIDLVCDEDREIPPPSNVALAALRYYIDCFKLKPGVRRVRVTVHHRKAYSVDFKLRGVEDFKVLKAVGSVPELLWKYELFIDKFKYRVRREGRLEISFVLKRRGIYSTVNINELVKEIYDRVEREWGGSLTVKAKVGAWGMEARYPR